MLEGSIGLGRLCGALALCTNSAAAHPHVFVDGQIDFVFSAPAQLQGIEVTWLYDPFETLYVLSALEIDPGTSWALTEDERAEIIAYESNWTDTFDGAARLAVKDAPVALRPPEGFSVRLVGNQLEVSFERALDQPVDIRAEDLEVTFYEETYFYAFTIAKASQLVGPSDGCAAFIDRFDPSTDTAGLQVTLMELSREETPEQSDVGRLFTDRIHLSCE